MASSAALGSGTTSSSNPLPLLPPLRSSRAASLDLPQSSGSPITANVTSLSNSNSPLVQGTSIASSSPHLGGSSGSSPLGQSSSRGYHSPGWHGSSRRSFDRGTSANGGGCSTPGSPPPVTLPPSAFPGHGASAYSYSAASSPGSAAFPGQQQRAGSAATAGLAAAVAAAATVSNAAHAQSTSAFRDGYPDGSQRSQQVQEQVLRHRSSSSSSGEGHHLMTPDELLLLGQQVDAAGALADAMLEQQQEQQRRQQGIPASTSAVHSNSNNSTANLRGAVADRGEDMAFPSRERLDQLRQRASTMRALTAALQNNTRSLQESTEELTARGRAWETAHSQVLTRVNAALEEANALSERERELNAQADFLRSRIAALEQQRAGEVQAEREGVSREAGDGRRLARVGSANQPGGVAAAAASLPSGGLVAVGGRPEGSQAGSSSNTGALQAGSRSSSNSNTEGRGNRQSSEGRLVADAAVVQGVATNAGSSDGGAGGSGVSSFPVSVNDSDVSTPTSCISSSVGAGLEDVDRDMSEIGEANEPAAAAVGSRMHGIPAGTGTRERGLGDCEGLGVRRDAQGSEVSEDGGQSVAEGIGSMQSSNSSHGRRGFGAWLRQLW